MSQLITKYTTLFLLSATCLFSCKKFLLEPPPKNQLVTAAVFADSLGANSAINGIYINMMQSFGFTFANGGITAFTGLTGDELYESTNNVTDAELYNNTITVDNSDVQVLWTSAYQSIYQTNACIQGIQNSPTISLTVKNSLMSEALVIRSFIYFNLVNLYGDVPLIAGTDYNQNAKIGRTPVSQVYQQLINDLKTAKSYLSKNADNNSRANYYAATALLAKVYLFDKQYSDADAQAEIVITSGKYSLVADLNSAFLAASAETIWSFAPVIPNYGVMEAYEFVPSSTGVVPPYVISNSLFNSFEPADLRKLNWISVDTVSNQSYPYPYKYKSATVTGTPTENYVVLRLADMYLIDAEAKANLNDLPDALANLNVIRKRAGLANVIANSQSSIISAIITERQHEFFCEWGNRWYDLNRLNLAQSIFGSEKHGWKNVSNLFPVPQNEINLNPALKQNPGY